MIYRENGQFKTSYRADQQILPIRQDRWAMLALLVLAFVVVPLTASDYMFRAVLLPFLIMSLDTHCSAQQAQYCRAGRINSCLAISPCSRHPPTCHRAV